MTWRRWMLGLALSGAVLLAAATWRLHRDPFAAEPEASASAASAGERQARGAYLARLGNCEGCHTARGGAPYAGGRALSTPFGTVYAGNLTPDAETGLGRWSAAEFRRALRHGQGRDGRWLVPAFPFAWFRHLSRDDADALWSHLRQLPPVRQANRPHALRPPFDTQLALAAWRLLFLPTAPLADAPGRDAEWQRGQALVEGIGHCGACHTPRNRWGATRDAESLQGATMPGEPWIAPSLHHADQAGVQSWPAALVAEWLKTGRNARAVASGPMAEVVWRSTQHLQPEDLAAMVRYLQTLPVDAEATRPTAEQAPEAQRALGARVYELHCASCHGAQGEGVAGLYLPLAGNRTVLMANPANLLLVIRHGGFAPATEGRPRPFGMPPFAHLIGPEEMAAVATHLRQSWGHQASAVSPWELLRQP